MQMSGVIRVRVPADLADRVERAAGDLNLDRSSFIRLVLTQKLRPASPERDVAV